MGHINIGPVYRVGQVKIEHSSETSLFQETEGENLLREWDFRPLVVLCFESFTAPQTPAELSNRDLAQMKIGGQRTAFEIYHCSKCKDL